MDMQKPVNVADSSIFGVFTTSELIYINYLVMCARAELRKYPSNARMMQMADDLIRSIGPTPAEFVMEAAFATR